MQFRQDFTRFDKIVEDVVKQDFVDGRIGQACIAVGMDGLNVGEFYL